MSHPQAWAGVSCFRLFSLQKKTSLWLLHAQSIPRLVKPADVAWCMSCVWTQTWPKQLISWVGLDPKCEKSLIPVPASTDNITWHLEGRKENMGLGVLYPFTQNILVFLRWSPSVEWSLDTFPSAWVFQAGSAAVVGTSYNGWEFFPLYFKR